MEDNDDIRTIVKSALEKIGGYQVHACASGAEALLSISDFAPQLLLLDMMMPGMDGPAVLAKVRERPEMAGLPVIFLTARASSTDIETLFALGALDVLKKPFDPMTLHEQVGAAWHKRIDDAH